MKIEIGIKIIIGLLVVIIVALASALVLMNSDRDPNGSEITTESVSDSGTQSTEESTTPNQTTEPDSSEPESSEPESSEPESSEPESSEPETSEPEITEPEITEPESQIPEDFVLNKTFTSDGKLKISVTVTSEVTSDGKIKLKAEMYLHHYELHINSKSNNILSLGKKEAKFTSSKIDADDSSHKTHLYTIETECEYGETVMLVAKFNAKCNYGKDAEGNRIWHETIEISESIEVK